jgi:hypothetical protein
MGKPTVLALLSIVLGSVALAQPAPLGPEFRVNTSTAGDQTRASVAMDSAGGFVVVWQGPSLDGDGTEILARRYDGVGAAVASEFRVNAYTTGDQQRASISMIPSGEFVVVWQGPQDDGPGLDIRAQRYDSDGDPVGTEFRVNTETGSDYRNPDVAMHDDGGFVVAWQSAESVYSSRTRARRFDAAGVPAGGVFPVDDSPAPDDLGSIAPAVATASNGEFVVAWHSLYYYNVYNMHAKRYDASGSPLCQVTLGSGEYPAGGDVARTPNDGVVAVWKKFSGAYDIDGRLFASCSALGAPFLVSRSPIQQQEPRVAVDASGRFLVVWERGSQGREVYAQSMTATGGHSGTAFRVNDVVVGSQGQPTVAMNGSGRAVMAWESFVQDGDGFGVFARRPASATSASLSVDVHPAGGSGSNLNGLLEPGETAGVEAEWRNALVSDLELTGIATLSGPAGPTYELTDDFSSYGSIAPSEVANCADTTGDCFAVTVSGPRPADHWDATLDETLSTGDTRTWLLHVGESFGDVPTTHPFYSQIERLLHSGISEGCGAGSYCPGDTVRRDQMAVFLLKAKHGSDYEPPSCTGIFDDVPCPGVFADWIERLFAEGITGGCGPGRYCPDSPVTREQMAVFLLKAKNGDDYAPPGCSGVFDDVPCPGVFSNWIEQLAADGITAGCGGGSYCPHAPNSRAQMAAFLVQTFGLSLYGP